MRLGTPYEVRIRIRLTYIDEIKPCLIFRNHHSIPKSLRGTRVPFVQSDESDTALRYYFCGKLLVPLGLHLPFLELTKDASDEEVLKITDDTLDAEHRLEVYKMQALSNRKTTPYTPPVIRGLLNKCIKKLHNKGLSEEDIATTLDIGMRRVQNVTRPGYVPENAGPRRQELGKRSVGICADVSMAPEFGAVKNAAAYARRKAYGMGLAATFLITDVFPSRHDVNGDTGAASKVKVVPRVCPVLRIPLSYDVFENNKGLNKVRVWRKTPGPDGMAPLSQDNVSIMSTAAAWAIEGAYGKAKLATLSIEMREALAQWQAKYGTRTVPRVTRVGRPRKEK